MTKLIAMYERESGLNVRKEPSPGAEVVRVMQKGDQAECLGVFKGWAQLEDGYANASFLDIALREAVTAVPTVTERASEPEPKPDDEASALNQMTNAQLYDLAEASGVKVSKGATKDELIAAILADE